MAVNLLEQYKYLSGASKSSELIGKRGDANIFCSMFWCLAFLVCWPVFNPGVLTQVVPQPTMIEKSENIALTTRSANFFINQTQCHTFRQSLEGFWFGP